MGDTMKKKETLLKKRGPKPERLNLSEPPETVARKVMMAGKPSTQSVKRT